MVTYPCADRLRIQSVTTLNRPMCICIYLFRNQFLHCINKLRAILMTINDTKQLIMTNNNFIDLNISNQNKTLTQLKYEK